MELYGTFYITSFYPSLFCFKNLCTRAKQPAFQSIMQPTMGLLVSCAGGLTVELLAFVIMIVLASFGLAVVLQTSEFIFSVIKFAGVAYLFVARISGMESPN